MRHGGGSRFYLQISNQRFTGVPGPKTKFWVFQVSNNDFQGHFKCNIQMCNSFATLLAIYLIIQMLAVANELTVAVKCA